MPKRAKKHSASAAKASSVAKLRAERAAAFAVRQAKARAVRAVMSKLLADKISWTEFFSDADIRRLTADDVAVMLLSGGATASDDHLAYDWHNLFVALLIRSAELIDELLPNRTLCATIKNHWLPMKFEPMINAYAAAFLAKVYLRKKMPMARAKRLSESLNWRDRLIAAWMVCDLQTPRATAIRKRLHQDDYVDCNEDRIVRWAAGGEM